MLVSRVVLLASLAPYLAWAQLGGPLENSAVEDCQCSPACEVSEGVAECRRLVPRPDCPCCRVCPQREGDACSESLPCDAEFGLVCSSEGVCKAEYSCAHDAECPEDRFCLGEVCVDPCPILTPCRGAISGGVCVSKDHRPVCECPQGTIANSEGNACIPYNDTVTGCEFEGRLYVEGEVRYDANCQEQCRCGSDGTFSCGPVTCPPGLFLAGQHSHQELCIELRNRPEADQCCVVVACANSLTRPSILTSPVLTHPTPVTQEEFLGDYEEYQRSLKDLEEELSKKNEKKKTDEKPSEKHKFESSFATATVSTTPGGTATDATAAVSTATDAATGTGTATDAAEETLSIPEVMMESTDVTPEEDTTFRPTEVEDPEQLTVAEVTEAEGFTTLMPLVREEAEQAMQEGQQATEGQAMQEEQQATEGPAMKEEQQATEGPAMKEEQQATEGQAMQEEQQATEEDEGQAAVVVEYGDDGEPIHRITVQEHVEVVPETTLAPYDDAATDTTTPALHQEQLSLAREGKMAPGDASSTQEEQVVVEFPKAESKVGAGALKVREVSHNSSTIVLPSTKGGEVYYKAAESSEWQRKIVGAGEDSIILKGLRPSTQYTLKWSGASGGSAKITIDTEEGCRVHNISYATGHEWSEGCQKRCSCRPAGTMDCQPRCLFIAGDITDPLCTERPAPEDPECCVVYDCKSVDTTELSSSATQENLGLPKLLVTEKTHSSITLAWDDFRARTYEGGYVAEYREKQGDSAASTTPEQPWMRKGVPTEERPPRLTVEGLKPNTLYEVRVSIYEDVEEGRLGEATETISVRTEAGCVHGNSSHAVGEFYNGCEERCMCVATGDVRCFERCTLPYFRAGSFKGDPMCSEHPDGSDECCVIVSCASDKRKAFSQCTNVVCGPNAECISGAMASKDLTDIDSDLTLGYCHCLEGFTGDASDLVFGCVSDPSVGHKEGSCTFKNSTYRPGDVFYDECDYRCACNNNTEIECEPRCEFPHEDGSEREPGCEYLPDPEDACCKLRVCISTSEAATDAARAPSLPSDGCTEGNITYARDEKFYKGCENQCICMGFGDVSCFPRCPPLKVVSEAPKRCETLPDPQDPCCSITVCAEETREVMKANITELKDEMKNMTEAEKEIMMEEVMMNMTEIEKEMTMKEMNMTESEKEKIMKEMNMTDMEEAMRNMTATEESEVDEMMAEEEVASTTVMPDGEMLVHFHSPLENMNEGHTHEHTHEDGLTHSHPLEHGVEETHRHNNTDETGQVIGDIHEQSVIEMQSHDIFNGTHNHTHTHDNNMDNSHDQEHDLDNMHTHEHTVEVGVNDWQNQNHDIFNGTHTHTHTHENGITHTHPHHHNMDNSHDHEHSKDDLHTHEDGVTHSHPHEHGKDNTHIHEHAHEDGTTHSHPHEHSIDETHNHEHDVEEVHNHTHMHGDGVLHTHPHDHAMDEDHNHTHSSSMDEVFDHTHTHEDGTTHSHPHGNVDHIHTHDASMDNFHNQTHFNVLEKKNRAEDLGTYDLNILEVMAINATTVVIKVAASDQVLEQVMSSDDQYFVILYSPDSLIWSGRNIPVSDAMIVNFNEIVIYLNDLQPSTPYQFRVRFQDFVSSTSKATLMDGTIQADGVDGVDVDTSMKCSLNGRYYKPGQEFYEGCSHSCICTETLEVHCAAIECPVTFGLELIDPNCLEWDLDPDYIPKPPKCCAQVKCISSSACQYMGQTFDNYEQIPRELTGCSQVCTCNYGNVTCRDLCDPVPNIPPPELKCDPQDAVLITLPGETCCRSWQCAANSVAEFEFLGTTEVVETTQFPGDSQDSIAEPRVMSVDARTAHFFFSTPALYQGLPGELFIRFTDDPVNHPDPSTWSKEVLVPMGSMISQSEWDHILSGLQPSTEYTVQLVLTVQGTEPVTSPVFTYTTMGEATTPSTTTPLPHLDINADLYASEITKTTAKVSWRVFKDMELQYIDGVLVKYTEEDKRIPKFSSMLHRDNNQVDLRDLQPGRSYTVDLDFIPHKNQTTQVSNTKNITFTTLPEEDPYAFEIEITAGKVSSQTAELFYSGIPEPEEKYVNVYRVVYLREVERIDAQTFKIPKTGQERKVFLNDLKPDIEYQVWLEAYLSNGRKKKSNVLTITTRAGELPKPERSEVDPSAKESEDGESYYPALVAVAIIAAIACLGFLGLLVILLRKQSHAKAHINSSRNNTRNNAAYDNPSYKVGDNTYDMEMNGIKGSGNGATHAEEP